jgi:hypothetical protein
MKKSSVKQDYHIIAVEHPTTLANNASAFHKLTMASDGVHCASAKVSSMMFLRKPLAIKGMD